MNPFDDDSQTFPPQPRSTNPFADDDSQNPAHEPLTTTYVSKSFETTPSDVDSTTWQDLGDLPYRRVRLASDVVWGRTNSTNSSGKVKEENEERYGLAWYPTPYVDTLRAHQSSLNKNDLSSLLATTTTTLCAGCPNGGPVACVTSPLGAGGVGFGNKTSIRIMSNSGLLISSIVFPRDLCIVRDGKRMTLHRSPGDIMTIGWTVRCILVVVLRDSLTLCYDMGGDAILPPFYALPDRMNGDVGSDLLEAVVFEGGVAVLGTDRNASVVELLDEHDDPTYADGADVTAWRVVPYRDEETSTFAPPPYYALVTPLPTALFAKSKHFSYGCIAVLPRQFAPSLRPELFLATSDGSVVVSELQPSTSANNGMTDVDCRSKIGGSGPDAPIVSMAFAPNGRFLACFTANSVLTVVSTTFESIVLEFDTSTGSSLPPRSMGWCGEDSVVMHMKNLGVLMVGPYGDWLRFPYGNDEDDHDGAVYLVPEIDCCRVVTSSSVEILQRVPPGTADLLRIGSIEPGALLLDASDAFDSGSSNADEAARAITQQEGLLEEAIRECIVAAEGEFDIDVQKRMLRAASYGLHFACRDENSKSRTTGRPSPEAVVFVKAARKLRTLNAIRKPSTGFAMTSAQYDSVLAKGVIARLLAAGHASLASAISEYLKLGRQVRDHARAMKATAFVNSCSSISHSNQSLSIMTDSQVAEEAIRIICGEEKGVNKMSEKDKQSTISKPSSGMYASVALAAHLAGRRGVADLLIMLEQSPTDKVRALLSIGSYADAAAVAARARDPDLIFLAMAAYDQSLDDKNTYFSGVVNKFPLEAVNMLTAYHSRIAAVKDDNKPMVNILQRRQKHAEAGSNIGKRAIALAHSDSSIMAENEREQRKVEVLKEASNIFGLAGKDCAFQKSCTDEYLDLIYDQEQLRGQYKTMDVAPPSSSVTSTIASILKYAANDPRSSHRLFSDADKLAKKYKVSEKRLWYVKVHAFSESNQWAVLRNLADSRAKSPIGMKPFALAAIKGRQGEAEIMHYMGRMQGQSDGEDRYELFCEAGMWRNAVDEAVKLGDGRRIAHVRSVCNSIEIQSLCDKYV